MPNQRESQCKLFQLATFNMNISFRRHQLSQLVFTTTVQKVT